MILNLPIQKVFVLSEYLTDNKIKNDMVEAYVFAVTCLLNRKLLFTVHTEHGAVYSRLPIEALVTTNNNRNFFVYGSDILDPWGTIGTKGQVIQHEYLCNYDVQALNIKDSTVVGRYWCTIDYHDGGFAQDPEQFKTSNLILLKNGQIAALPNNYCKFIDDHFINKGEIVFPYSRTKKFYR